MKKTKKIITLIFSAVLILSLILSFVDTVELPTTSDFDQDKITAHIEKMCEYGPHSIADKEENQLVMEYIISEVEKLGVINSDTTDVPAYLVQEYVSSSVKYQNFYLKNVVVHIPANAENVTNEAVMVMAHYDSVPMGQGAADDALACSTMLEAIRYYSERMKNGYTIANDLVFCFVNGEEYGLYGSEAFVNEFDGFNDLVERINFAINLEARGTAGTQIMFETSEDNYNTVKLFCEVNKNLFTCSVATRIYGMMPNGTDFSNLKNHYQGVNMANIGGGENYHTQNDNPANVGTSYATQQAQIVNGLLYKLANYDLNKLYDTDESAIFFSYLNIGDVVYDLNVAIVLAVIGTLLLAANIVISIVNKKKALARTAKAVLSIIIGLALTAGVTFGCYYLFQLIAALAGNIDIHAIGTISFSNIPIIIGIGLLALGVTVLTTHFSCKLFRTEARDVTRAFAYIHVVLGVALSFAIPDASYLFILSGILLMINELCISFKSELADLHGELLATALYLPLIVPIIVLATSALGLSMAYVFGLLFALAIYGVGSCIAPVCGYFSVNAILNKNKEKPVSSAWGALHIISAAMVVFLCVSLAKPDPNVNLQGKQGISKLMYDDALVYSLNENGEYGYYVYDLNAYSALRKYCPEMEYSEEDECYIGSGEKLDISASLQCHADGNVITVKKNEGNSTIYLSLFNATADSLTINDGITSETYEIPQNGYFNITIHSDCTVTLNGGGADVSLTESIIDYPSVIPAEYADGSNRLHFNLWLNTAYFIR
ncbi:MAG: M28 family peptidase [Oscillospiraceae bacterium]|nr:M28 family peptidase [Oscillospiraceae bacterium]